MSDDDKGEEGAARPSELIERQIVSTRKASSSPCRRIEALLLLVLMLVAHLHRPL